MVSLVKSAHILGLKTTKTPKPGNWTEERFFMLCEYVIIHYC